MNDGAEGQREEQAEEVRDSEAVCSRPNLSGMPGYPEALYSLRCAYGSGREPARAVAIIHHRIRLEAAPSVHPGDLLAAPVCQRHLDEWRKEYGDVTGEGRAFTIERLKVTD